MLFYIDEFPERLHPTKETTLLFPMIREQVPQLGVTLDRLETDHHRGEASVRALGHRLLAYEVLGEPRRQAFEEGARRCVEAYLRDDGARADRARLTPRRRPLNTRRRGP